MPEPVGLPQMPAKRLSGEEEFHEAGSASGFNVLGFWRWATSDLLSNALRGVLAEYLVGQALGVADGARTEWDAWDLMTSDGLRVEVKSAAYIQSWHQSRPSEIRFGIRPTRAWDSASNRFGSERRRHADVYVFCVLANRDPKTIDPLDLGQWDFYVVETSRLDRLGDQQSLGLSRIRDLAPSPVNFEGLAAAVSDATKR